MTPPLTQAQAEGLKELLAKATPGPWAYRDMMPHTWGPAFVDAPDVRDLAICGDGTRRSETHGFCLRMNDGESEANAQLIVAAVNSLPALLAERRAMVEALMAAKQFIVNGVECGFIRMPEYQDDPAHNTLPLIESVLARALLGAKP